MKLETGYTQTKNGVPKELEIAAKAMARACSEVKFFATTAGIYYAVGEIASGVMGDIYFRYEKRIAPPVFNKEKAAYGPDKVMVTITCYGVFWLPLIHKPQLCVYERKMSSSTDPVEFHIVAAECWAAVNGAASLFPIIDSQGGFSRNMARIVVHESKSIMPTKVFTKLKEAFSNEELPGMPPTNRTDVLARFVTATQGYILPSISKAHRAFYFSLFRPMEARIVLEKDAPDGLPLEEITLVPCGKVDYLFVETSKQIDAQYQKEEKGIYAPVEKHETRTVAEETQSPALDEPDEPTGGAIGVPAPPKYIETRSAEIRLGFKYPDRHVILGNLVKQWKADSPSLTEDELYELGVKYQTGCEEYDAKKSKDAPKILAPSKGRAAVSQGEPPISSGEPRMPMPRMAMRRAVK